VKAYFADLKAKRAAAHGEWKSTFARLERRQCWPGQAELDAARNGSLKAEDLLKVIPEYPAEGKAATRNSGGEIINHSPKRCRISSPAAPTSSAPPRTTSRHGGDFSACQRTGRNIWFGIREHAMGAICNGIAYDGLFLGSCATFLVFADYCRPSIRIAALRQTARHLHLHA
jgi:transketolase